MPHKERAALHWTQSSGGMVSRIDNERSTSPPHKTCAAGATPPLPRLQCRRYKDPERNREGVHPRVEAATVLLVEDDDDLRISLQAFLAEHVPGIQVVAVDNGIDALANLTIYDVHVILTDYQLPGMDGLEILARARQLRPEVPRILMSAHATIEVATEGVNRERIKHLLHKPLDLQDTVRAVHAAVTEFADQRRLADGFRG